MVYFESRNEKYKKPFGALRADTDAFFLVEVEESIDVQKVHFVVRSDSGPAETFVMKESGISEGKRQFTFFWHTPKEDLYFYRFEVVRGDGSFLFVGAGKEGKAVVGDWLPEWPLTVYAADFNPPKGLAGGVMYQVFPDRFARDNDAAPLAPAKGARYFRSDVTEAPWGFSDPARPGGKDFFGGTVRALQGKLEYLKSLGITVLYLNPVFESSENHRYSTGNYRNIDPWFGTNEEMEAFLKAAKEAGIKVIFDGVFSHTGDDSIYFNKYSHYEGLGAYNSPDSPYYSWYDFRRFPDDYAGWWGFTTLPNVNETDPSYLDFITHPEDGVLAFWQKKGLSGWRLDVADELPDLFLEKLREAVKTVDPDAYIVGEVWENAVEKVSYGARRRFILGKQCDSVMNYPWRAAIFELLRTGDAEKFAEQIMQVCEGYPAPALHTLMNILSTHDTMRALTALGDLTRSERRTPEPKLVGKEYEAAREKLIVAAALQYMLPGIPCIYYGDEIGMQGTADPYCRGFFQWNDMDEYLLAVYRTLGRIRTQNKEAFCAEVRLICAHDGVVAFARQNIEIWVSVGNTELSLPTGEILFQSTASKGAQVAILKK